MTVPAVLSYDAEADADWAVDEYLMGQGDIDGKTMVSERLERKWWGVLGDNGWERWEGVKKRGGVKL